MPPSAVIPAFNPFNFNCLEEALKVIEESLQLYPEQKNLYRWCAKYYTEKGRYDEALSMLETLIRE